MLHGRHGHARVAVLTVIPEETEAVASELGPLFEIPGTGASTPMSINDEGKYPLVLVQSTDRSNMPSMETVRDLLEDWRPEVVILVGVAGAIVRMEDDKLDGLHPGDVVGIEYVHYGEYAKRSAGKRFKRYLPMVHPSTELITRWARPISRQDWWTGDMLALEGAGRTPHVEFGEIVSVEFVAGDASAEEQRAIFAEYDHAVAVDMESAGVARAIHRAHSSVHYCPVWLGIRGISDQTGVDEEAQALCDSGSNNAQRRSWKPTAATMAARFTKKLLQGMLSTARPPHEGDPGMTAWLKPAEIGGRE